MKKINIILLLTILILPIATAHEPAHEPVDPGVTPDSFLWGLDKALDNLNLLLTFNPAEKAKKGIEIARERLEEIKVMAEQNKLEAAEKGKEAQLKVLSKVKQSISEIKEEASTKQIEEEIELETELEEHEEEIEEASSNLKIKIEVKGALNEQQKALLDSILSSLKNKTNEVKIEIKNKKDKTKIKIKQETGKSEIEIENEIEEIEKEKGLTDIKKEKAMEEIEDAKEDLAELEEELQEHKSEGHVADEKPITILIDNAKKRISNAEEAFAKNGFGEAFGQANAAKQLIENAERVLEKTVERFEEEEGEHEEEEREIEVKIEDKVTKVKIEVNDEKLRFRLETIDKNTIIQEIAEKTGLSVDEVAKLAKFEEEKEPQEKEKGKETKLCKVGGCSGQLCGEASFVDNIVTTCEWKEEYACYQKHGKCEIQADGQCGWTQTKDLLECIEKGKKEVKNKVAEDKESCEAQSGKWGRHGLAGIESCVLPTSDGGKECSDSDECESYCIAEDKGAEKPKGKCSEWKQIFGCFTLVEEGGLGQAVCID